MRTSSYKVVKVNIDDEPTLAQEYDVQSIPMIGLFRNGRLERTSLGLKAAPADRSRARDARHPLTGRSRQSGISTSTRRRVSVVDAMNQRPSRLAYVSW